MICRTIEADDQHEAMLPTTASFGLAAVSDGTGSFVQGSRREMTSLITTEATEALGHGLDPILKPQRYTARQSKAAAQWANSSADIVLLAVRNGGKRFVHMRRSIRMDI
jgi:hypothetical protein